MTREQNYPLLHQNGTVFWLQRNIEVLPTDGRPLSQAGKLEAMYQFRRPMYEAFADWAVDNDHSPEGTVAQILSRLEEKL